MNADGRVKERSFNLPLLIKLHGLISSMQLSFGISLCKKWFVSIGFGCQQLFHHLHVLIQIAFYHVDSYFSGYFSE